MFNINSAETIPPLRPQHGSGIDETMGFITNNEDENDIWDIITNINGEIEHIQNLKKKLRWIIASTK